MVECENGVKFYADHVICTVPLGVIMERADSLFQPALPPDKATVLDRLHFGTVNKIFLEYERPFLSPDIDEVILLWDKLDAAAATADAPMKERWFRKIYSFSKVNETMLVGWIAGEEARFMETLKMNVVAETCTALIKKFLADPYVPKPKSCVFTAWHSQPYSRGSYTAIGVGGQQSDVEKVAEPLYQKPLNRTVRRIPRIRCQIFGLMQYASYSLLLFSLSWPSEASTAIRLSTRPSTAPFSPVGRPPNSC